MQEGYTAAGDECRRKSIITMIYKVIVNDQNHMEQVENLGILDHMIQMQAR